jgi:hypothetical protein
LQLMLLFFCFVMFLHLSTTFVDLHHNFNLTCKTLLKKCMQPDLYLFFIEIHPTVQSYSIMTKTCFVEFDPMNVSSSYFCYSLDISRYLRKTNYFKFTTAPRKVTNMFNKGYWHIYQQLCYIRRSKQKSDPSMCWKKKCKNIFHSRLDTFKTLLPP